MPAHGSISVTLLNNATVNGTQIAAQADITCTDGYQLNPASGVGSTYTMLCKKKGAVAAWSPLALPNNAIPNCDARKCDVLTAPTNGRVVYTNFDSQGKPLYPSAAIYTCNEKYVLDGLTDAVKHCLTTGKWDSSVVPKCVAVACPTLVVPVNGYIASVSADGKTVTWGCNAGYALNWPYGGSGTTSTCSVTGILAEWNAFPQCLPRTCGSVPNAGNLVIQYTNNQLYPSDALFSCPEGNVLEPAEAGSAACAFAAPGSSVNTWVGAIPTCVAVPCPALHKVANGGDWQYTDVNVGNVKSEATVACDPGYSMTGPATLECISKGSVFTWSADAPKCTPMACLSNPTALTDGVVSVTNNGYYPSSAIFTCNDGFILSDVLKEVSDCELDVNGVPRFPTNNPTCEAVACPGLSNPFNGFVSTAPDGSVAVFECYDNYELYPSPNIPGSQMVYACQKKGTTAAWVPVDPKDPKNFPKCLGKVCPSLPFNVQSPLEVSYSNNGVNEAGPRYPSVAVFSCSGDGYVLTGPRSSTCYFDSNSGQLEWSFLTAYPNCEAVPLPGLAMPEHAASLTVNDMTATITCDPGYFEYTPNGTDTGKTSFNVTARFVGSVAYWDNQSSCKAKKCPELNPSGSLTVTYASVTVTYTNDRVYPSTAIFNCDDGYYLSPAASQSVNCLDTYQWDSSVTIPACYGIPCGPLQTPAFGEIFTTAIDATLGPYAVLYSIVCNEGYEASGPTFFACANPGANVSLSNYNYGGGVVFLDPTGNAIATKSTTHCQPLSCGTPAAVANAVVDVSNAGNYPSSATYTCKVGYVLKNSSAKTARCVTTSPTAVAWNWTTTAPECIAAAVNPYPPPSNGWVDIQIDPDNAIPPNATVYCNDGYGVYLGSSGPSSSYTVVANFSGSSYVWGAIEDQPYCKGLSCDTSKTVSNAVVTFSNNGVYPSNAYIQCKVGYVLSDTRKGVAQCMTDGGIQSNDLGWRFNGAEFSDLLPEDIDFPTCVALSCSVPAAPVNGFVTYGTDANGKTTLKVACNEPYGLSLNGVSYDSIATADYTCSSGEWAPALQNQFPVCLAPDCGDPQSFAVMTTFVTNFNKYPAFGVYKCDATQQIAYYGRIQCTSDGPYAASWKLDPLGNPGCV